MVLLRSKRELLKIRFNHLLTLDGLVNLARWDFPFLGQPVGEHHHGFSREEVKHPIMNPLIACPELVDAISQKVCLRPAGVHVPTRQDDRSVPCTWPLPSRAVDRATPKAALIHLSAPGKRILRSEEHTSELQS